MKSRVLVFTATLALFSCVPPTEITPEVQKIVISVDTEPKGANVIIQDRYNGSDLTMGVTPIEIAIDGEKLYQVVKVTLDGYEDEYEVVDKKDSILVFELESDIQTGIFAELAQDSLYTDAFISEALSLANAAELLLNVPPYLLEYEATKWKHQYEAFVARHMSLYQTSLMRGLVKLNLHIAGYSISHTSEYLINTPGDRHSRFMISTYIFKIKFSIEHGR